ncbi:MAG: DUF86 domain-containing protein [Bacteroidetes bacterium]|nr:DUF86 domain-containing protein [Bacteroidota bacterium]MBS1943140.1 DUF86 domain-containing protein [Bacteroidota bacterium]
MSERTDKARLIDMLTAAERIVAGLQGVDEEAFLVDMDKRDSTVLRLQIIGEAAYHITDGLKSQYPEVEWFKIQGLRHKIVHDSTPWMIGPSITSPWTTCHPWWSS